MPRRVRASAPKTSAATSRKTPIVTVRADPLVLSTALELAGGDRRRLVVEAGGSVLVKNPT